MNQNSAVHLILHIGSFYIVLRFSVKLWYLTAKLTNNKPQADLQIFCYDYEEWKKRSKQKYFYMNG